VKASASRFGRSAELQFGPRGAGETGLKSGATSSPAVGADVVLERGCDVFTR
jgi:hypothetical protein